MKTSSLLSVALASMGLVALGSAAAYAEAPASPSAAPSGAVHLNLPGAATAATTDSRDPSALMTAALQDVDGYWTRKFAANNLPEPTVRYAWLPAGQSTTTACSNEPTDDTAAFYCPGDDTIYLSEAFADAVRADGLSRWPSGDRPSQALGDMAVAYVIAHEEAHNIQTELGIFDRAPDTKSTELQADCLAGAWASDAASRGVIDSADKDVATATAWLVGDYALDNPGHHGTPQEREDAFTKGFDSLSSCWAYTSGQ